MRRGHNDSTEGLTGKSGERDTTGRPAQLEFVPLNYLALTKLTYWNS
jgi:hypothetical protein